MVRGARHGRCPGERGIARYCLVLPDITRYCLVLPGIAWYYLILPGIAWYCPVLPGIARYCPVLPGIAWYCPVLPGIARYCLVLPGTTQFTGYYRVLPGIIGYYRVLLPDSVELRSHFHCSTSSPPSPSSAMLCSLRLSLLLALFLASQSFKCLPHPSFSRKYVALQMKGKIFLLSFNYSLNMIK
jgi:hypothetical protein